MQAPEPFANVYDPIDTLAFVAAKTSRISLGTSVLDSLFQSPVILARRLATLDRLSGGRLVVGIGQGWMEQEFVAAGVPMKRRGAGFEEHIRAMQAVWGPDPVTSTVGSTESPPPTSVRSRSGRMGRRSSSEVSPPRRSNAPRGSAPGSPW